MRGSRILTSIFIGRKKFSQPLRNICDELLRQLALAMMLDIISSDGVLVSEETSLIAQVVDCWKLGYRTHRTVSAKRGVEASRDNWQAQYRHAESRF